jgi:hypothetical protein
MPKRIWVAVLLMVGFVAGCEVPNPAYDRWDQFGVGSSVTYEGTQTMGEKSVDLEITKTLTAKTFNEMTIETKIIASKDGKTEEIHRKVVEKRFCDPKLHPSTHPSAKVTSGGKRAVLVKGRKPLICKVIVIDVEGKFGGEMMETEQDLDIEAAISESVPGGIVEMDLKTKSTNFQRSTHAKLKDYNVK